MDVFHSMNDAPKVKCEECGSTRTKKLIGTGAGIIFKGSGFYETDYKTKTGKKDEKSGTDSSKNDKKASKSEGKSSSTPAAKSESKSSSTSSKGAKSD
jgi:putative FmdB family regulatory protein